MESRAIPARRTAPKRHAHANDLPAVFPCTQQVEAAAHLLLQMKGLLQRSTKQPRVAPGRRKAKQPKAAREAHLTHGGAQRADVLPLERSQFSEVDPPATAQPCPPPSAEPVGGALESSPEGEVPPKPRASEPHPLHPR